MQRIKRTAAAVLMLAGIALSSAVAAAPLCVNDDPITATGFTPNIKVHSSVSFTHDLSDTCDALADITSAALVIVLTDHRGNEEFRISLGAGQQVYEFRNIGGTTPFSFPDLSLFLADLRQSGQLSVTISVTDCNAHCDPALQFVSSTLTAQVKRAQAPTTATEPDSAEAPAAVPEPGTLTLLGLGLAGIAALRRPRRANAACPRASGG